MTVDEHIQKEYFKKSYFAVDGLWFMKLEEEFGFETALNIDCIVWEVLPKIQARKLKELLGINAGRKDLKKALEVKFEIEDYEYEAELSDVLTVTISKCPWLEIMEKAGRGHLAGKVGEVVCSVELSTWGKEFGCNMDSTSKKCVGANACKFVFR